MGERAWVVSVLGPKVEPTEAFSGWLEDLRQQEDQPTAVQPAEQPKALPPEVPPPAALVSTGTLKRKRYFKHLSRYPREAGLEMAARIKELIETHRSNGETLPLSALKRSLHADRHSQAWREAIGRLVVHRIAKVADGEITLRPSEFELPDPYGRPKPNRPKRNRPQSDWLRENRAKMDAGQHSDFFEDWSDEDEEDDDLAAEKAWWGQLDEKGEED
jgi:hypothetical protein